MTRMSVPEKSISLVVVRMPKWLNSPCATVMSTTAIVCCSNPQDEVLMPKILPRISPVKRLYTPTLTEAMTKMSPSMLNHAVAQPQPRPPRMEDQW
jgi:hypothetical protein